MEKKYDVTALGELLIDFAVNGESEQGNQLFEACPGGAPCNVLAMLNKLGRKTAVSLCSGIALGAGLFLEDFRARHCRAFFGNCGKSIAIGAIF